ncbi:hypothetical protein 7t3_0143 [Salmonella phage 7t3]|nr:hypothetical protein 7t3_0143 [Salmonella phage 7t3]
MGVLILYSGRIKGVFDSHSHIRMINFLNMRMVLSCK